MEALGVGINRDRLQDIAEEQAPAIYVDQPGSVYWIWEAESSADTTKLAF